MDSFAFASPGDAVLVEVVGNRLVAVADEMSATLTRSAYSTSVKESADASSALLDARGQLLAQSTGTLAVHTSSLRECLRSILGQIPLADIGPGDVIAMNDPYRGGIHTNDVAVFTPVFVDGRLAYFAGAIVHVADLGGVAAGGLPSQARDVFEEGLLLPPVWLQRNGVLSAEICGILQVNSRVPDKVMGDVKALVAAVNVGAARMAELAERYGEGLDGIVEQMLAYSEARIRAELSALPLGEWTAGFAIDGDGVTDRDHHVTVTLRHTEPEAIVVDLTGTSGQAGGPINAAYSQGLSGALVGVRCFLSPDLDTNEALFRCVETVLPPGSLVNPHKPAAVNARIVTVSAVVEALLQVLGTIDPDRAIAGSAMHHMYTMCSQGTDPTWVYMDLDFGGVGARHELDGVDASGPYFHGGRGLSVQMEAIEAEYPVRFLRSELACDSGGPGRWRGGTGLVRQLVVLEPAEVTVRADRIRFPPVGRDGGRPGSPGGFTVTSPDGEVTVLASKQMSVPLRPGDVLTMTTSGGGGLGDPFARDVEAVRADVRRGVVSPAGAARDYGVVVDPASLAVDLDGTAELRARGPVPEHEGERVA